MQAPKNAIEVKELKNNTDSGRPQSDCGLRISNQSPVSNKRKALLSARIAATIKDPDGEDEPAGLRDVEHDPRLRDWWQTFLAASRAMELPIEEYKDSPTAGLIFTCNVIRVYEENIDKDLLPGILCTKVIDRCREDRAMWPPEFLDHRDRLRKRERLQGGPRTQSRSYEHANL